MKYYPTSRVTVGLSSIGGEFTLDGLPFKGSYYTTYEGKYFTGNDPVTGDSKELKPIVRYTTNVVTNEAFAVEYNGIKNIKPLDLASFVEIKPFYPVPTELDYERGFIFRYFSKKRNDTGNLKEVSQTVFLSLQSPNSIYNYQMHHAIEIYWQLTGPLRDTVNTVNGVRTSGIEDTNRRLTESKNVGFKGLTAHIGNKYSKFARPS